MRLTSLRLSRALMLNVVMSVILVAASVWTFAMQVAVNEERTRVRHKVDLFIACDQVYSDVRDMETGQRGYMITGNTAYLKPYVAKSLVLKEHIVVYQSLCQTEQEFDQFDEINNIVQLKAEELSRSVELEQNGKHPEALSLIRTDVGKSCMESLAMAVAVRRQDYQASVQSWRKSLDVVAVNCAWILTFALISIWTTFVNFVWEKRAMDRSKEVAQSLSEIHQEWKAKIDPDPYL